MVSKPLTVKSFLLMKVEDVSRAEAFVKLVEERLAHDIESLDVYIKEKDEIDIYILQLEDDIRTSEGDEKQLEQLKLDEESLVEYISESVRFETYIRQLKNDINIREETVRLMWGTINMEDKVKYESYK